MQSYSFAHFFQSCPCAHVCDHSDPCVLAQDRAQKHRTLSLARGDRERCDSLVVCCWMWLFEELNPRAGPRLNGRLISSSSSSSSPLFFSLHFFNIVSCFVFRFFFFLPFSLFSSFSLFHIASFYTSSVFSSHAAEPLKTWSCKRNTCLSRLRLPVPIQSRPTFSHVPCGTWTRDVQRGISWWCLVQ